MVKIKFCPECASLQIKRSLTGEQCSSCGFKGEMKEGAPDEINSYKDKLKKKGAGGDVMKPVTDLNKRESEENKAKRELLKQKYSSSNSDLEVL